MAKYIDLTGLAELWAKIKAYAASKSGDSLTGDYTITGKLTATKAITTASTVKAAGGEFGALSIKTPPTGGGADTGVTFDGGYDESGETPYLQIYGSEAVEDVELTGIAAPTENNGAANKKYVDDLIATCTKEPTLKQFAGEAVFTLETNAEYLCREITKLNMTVSRANCHGFIAFDDTFTNTSATLSILAPTTSTTQVINDGDDITEAAAGELWEFSARIAFKKVTEIYVCIVWKNWSAV